MYLYNFEYYSYIFFVLFIILKLFMKIQLFLSANINFSISTNLLSRISLIYMILCSPPNMTHNCQGNGRFPEKYIDK